jgi:hypothetical protein
MVLLTVIQQDDERPTSGAFALGHDADQSVRTEAGDMLGDGSACRRTGDNRPSGRLGQTDGATVVADDLPQPRADGPNARHGCFDVRRDGFKQLSLTSSFGPFRPFADKLLARLSLKTVTWSLENEEPPSQALRNCSKLKLPEICGGRVGHQKPRQFDAVVEHGGGGVDDLAEHLLLTNETSATLRRIPEDKRLESPFETGVDGNRGSCSHPDHDYCGCPGVLEEAHGLPDTRRPCPHSPFILVASERVTRAVVVEAEHQETLPREGSRRNPVREVSTTALCPEG